MNKSKYDNGKLATQVNDAIELASFGDDLLFELEDEVSEISQELRDYALLVTCPYDFAANNAFLTIKWGVDVEEISTDYIHTWGYHLHREYSSYLSKSFQIYGMEFGSSLYSETFKKQQCPYPLEYGLHVNGEYAFAMLQSEAGIHNLKTCTVISNLDCQIEIEVIPDIDLNIDRNDCIVDVYGILIITSSGPRSLDSGVRITHLPTGVVAHSHYERSQHKNRLLAQHILAGRVYMHEQNALSNPTVIREYDLDKRQILDKRMKKSYLYTDKISDALPQIFEDTLSYRINSMV